MCCSAKNSVSSTISILVVLSCSLVLPSPNWWYLFNVFLQMSLQKIKVCSRVLFVSISCWFYELNVCSMLILSLKQFVIGTTISLHFAGATAGPSLISVEEQVKVISLIVFGSVCMDIHLLPWIIQLSLIIAFPSLDCLCLCTWNIQFLKLG